MAKQKPDHLVRQKNFWSGKRDSNSRPSPWQGDALPLSYFRNLIQFENMVREKGLEPPRPKTPDPNSGASAIPPLPHILSNDGSNTFRSPLETNKIGWGGWIRTNECRSQSPVPYRLATPQSAISACNLYYGVTRGNRTLA